MSSHPEALASPSASPISQAQILEALTRIDFLAHLKARHLSKHIPKLIGQSFLRTYADGEKILSQGEHGHSLLVLLQGSLQLSVSVSGQTRELAKLSSAVDRTLWFGEGPVLGHTLRSSTATALGPVTVLEIEKVRLERLDGVVGGIIDRIDRVSRERTIDTLLVQHRAFSALTPEERSILVEGGVILAAGRGDRIFKEGDQARSVLLLRVGSAKLTRQNENKEKVLAYFSSGDVIGMSDERVRGGTLTALDQVEYVELDQVIFNNVKTQADARIQLQQAEGKDLIKWSDQLNKAENAKAQGGLASLSSKTSMNFVEQFLGEGAQVAQSLLTIDLDLCVRCGNCVVACESRHGYAKMTRRGKKLIRRRQEDRTEHQPLLLPSSCRHCESPECMIGCPTGAIHRKPTGEVAIHDFCIGCSNCALRCPWDNITMVPTPGRWVLEQATKAKLDTPKIASKCDLCSGYDEANCVTNCPTKAILRVEPSYFPEVRAALGEQHRSEEGRTSADRDRDLSKWVLLFLTLLVGIGLVAAWRTTADYNPWSTAGVGLGTLTLLFLLATLGLTLRKRLKIFPRKPPHPNEAANPKKAGRAQLGAYYLWTRAHYGFGALAVLAMVLHMGLVLQGGLITTLLAALVFLEVFLGMSGLVLYRLLPKVISRLEKDDQVQEDVEDKHKELRKRRAELLAAAEPEVVKAAKKGARIAKGTGSRFFGSLSESYDSKQIEERALEQVTPLLSGLGPGGPATVLGITRDAVRMSELSVVRWMYRLRRAFIATHITISGMILMLSLAHVVTVLYFFLRFR